MELYKDTYQRSLKPDFWESQAVELLTWQKPFTTGYSGDFGKGESQWFKEGTLNACYNCVDRHASLFPNKIALIYEGDEIGEYKEITFMELKRQVMRMANILKSFGLKKGDCVAIYMPMILEAAYAMLACARLGIIHNVVFAGFSAESLKDRIIDSNAKVVITANEGRRGGKPIFLKQTVDLALKSVSTVEKVLVVKRIQVETDMKPGRDYWLDQFVVDAECECVEMSSEDTLFYLYTSGSTGKPKGIAHSTAGYLVYTSLTFKAVFDFKSDDIFGCMADVGWITGHSYIIYGPLCAGATSVMFESIPTYPTPSRYWQLVEKCKITHLYTAPTVIRVLQRLGESFINCDLSSLKVIGTVGEPIGSDAWNWYHVNVGKQKCAVVDTYWQTETGGIVITTLPGIMSKPGCAGLPLFGLELTGNNVTGVLAIKRSWPSVARTILKDHDRFVQTYFKAYKDLYFTGDSAMRDQDGYYSILGRVDDVINVCGHRLSTAEIEDAICRHQFCAESAALGRPDDVTGQSIIVFCILKPNQMDKLQLESELRQLVKEAIGPIAHIKQIVFPSDLPKTRSGKIMRRLLRKIVSNEADQLGDLSTLNNPQVIEEIIQLVN